MEDPSTPSPVRSLTSQAFDRLRADILAGALRPNERLRIQQLSERYDVGATAIREALSRLVTEGLVESEDQRGFCVSAVSRDELQDLTRTRIWAEQTALRLAIEHGDLEWESAVLASFHRLSKAPSPASDPAAAGTWRAAHRQFHFTLLSGCGSPWTVRLCALLYDQTERYRSLASRTTGHKARDVLKEHRQLMDAVLARDAGSACELVASHFQSTTDLILAAGVLGAAGADGPPPRRKAA